jgi:putative membrane protein
MVSDDELAHLPPPTQPAHELRKIERPSPLTGLANAWLAVVGVAFFGGREVAEGNVSTDQVGGALWIVLAAFAVIAVIGIGVGLLQWRTTTFIVDHEFRIERRLISRSTTRIDFTKVQSVDIHRPIAARVLGLAEVKIDVGGQGGQSLRFLRNDRAESLRDHLLARMGESAPTTTVTDAAGQPPPPLEVVYRATPSNIALGSFLSLGPLGMAVAVFILVIVVVMTQSLPFFALAALLGIFWQVPKNLMTNWDFTVARAPQGLRIQRGAFTRVQMTLRPDRVQAMALEQSLLMRLAGLYTVRLTVLGNASIGEDSGNIDVLMPFGRWEEARYVLGLVWPEVDPERFAWVPQSPRGRRLSWFARHEFAVTDDVFATRHRLLDLRVAIVPHARVQGLGLRQGPLQRWFRLGRVQAFTIDGPVRVAAYHLDVADARRLFEEQLARSADARKRRDAEPLATPTMPPPPPALPDTAPQRP